MIEGTTPQSDPPPIRFVISLGKNPTLRLMRLVITARVRGLGLTPWLLLLAGAVWCAAQEPLDFRHFRIQILYQGVWLMAFALHCQLLASACVEGRQGASWLLAGGCQLVAISLLQALLAYAIDVAMHPWVTLDSALRSGCYLLVAAGGYTAAATSATNHPQGFFGKLLTAVTAVLGLAVASSLWTDGWSMRASFAALLLLAAGASAIVTTCNK